MEIEMRLLSHGASLRLMELARQPHRPSQIIKLKEGIEAKTRVLELKASIGSIDEAEIREVLRMKLELDRLYGLWAE